jgi:hypothetical protein
MPAAIPVVADAIGTFFTADATAAATTAVAADATGAAAGTAVAAGAGDAAASGLAAGFASGAGAAAGGAAGAAATTGLTAGEVAGGAAAAGGASAAGDIALTQAPIEVTTPASVAVQGPGGIAGTGITAGEASAAATGASAIYTLAQGRQGISIPPAPGQIQNDAQAQAVQQQTLEREQAAGGLQSTVGTSGGQAGAILSPATTSNRSILGG